MSFLRRLSSNAKLDTNVLSTSEIESWDSQIKADPKLALAATVVGNTNVDEVLIKRDVKSKLTTGIFNNVVEPQGAPITNQQSSGRCWLFAGTNVFRIPIMQKYELENLRLSPTYLFFYDKLEKANFFLEQIIDTADEDVDSRIVQHLLSDPISDGGQFGMLANVVAKYGIVPNDVFPDNDNSLRSAQVNRMVKTLLHQYAQELRETAARKKDVAALRRKQMKTIHQLLVIFLGSPPGPNDEIIWEYVDKNKKFGSVTTTPLKFAQEIVSFDVGGAVSLLNDPRNTYDTPIHIERLGNIVESPEVTYLNKSIDVLASKAIERIKANKPVFFGTHTPIYHHNGTGIISTELWDFESLGFKPTQDKANRLRYGQSLMTHAMVFTGVHLNENGEPIRWKVENSWGDKTGMKGFYTMSHDFFKEYVYQVVIEGDEASEFDADLKKKPIDLPPWDPCGALAE